MPHISIIIIGCILNRRVPTKAKKNIAILTMNTNVLSVGEPKFSFDMSMMEAAARSPTIAGRSVEKMLFTCRDSLCLMR